MGFRILLVQVIFEIIKLKLLGGPNIHQSFQKKMTY